MQLVVVSAVMNAVSAATIIFTATSMILFFVITLFILRGLFCLRIVLSKEYRRLGVFFASLAKLSFSPQLLRPLNP